MNLRRGLAVAFLLILAVSVYGVTSGKLSISDSQPNVLVLLLDTTRADHLSAYGYERHTSPNLDDFAREAVKFDFAIAAAPWTPASVGSIFTGMFVSSHGLMPPNDRETARHRSATLDPRLDTLAEALREGGYTTAAISTNPWINRDFAFDEGFEHFVYKHRALAEEVTAGAKRAIPVLTAKGKPFFLYLHYLDPHDPYTPPAPYDSKFSGDGVRSGEYSPEMLEQIARYDGEISYLDASLGNLFTFLREHDLYDDTMIVVVGDHGEQFEEQGFLKHGNTVFNTETHVPMIVKPANSVEGSVVTHTVSTVDLYATILTEAGIAVPAQAEMSVPLFNRELQEQRTGVTTRIARILQQRAYINYDGFKLVIGGSKKGDMHPIDDPTQNIIGLYNSRKDRFEESPIMNRGLLAELQSEFRDVSRKSQSLTLARRDVGRPVSDETLRDLKSLGYLN